MKDRKTLDQLINERRSVRKYLDRPVESGKLNLMLEAAGRAPSACNAQPWRFAVISDSKLKDELASSGLGGVVPNAWAKTAPCIVVACSDTSFFTHRLGEMAQGVQYHLIDLGIALDHLVLKATELGLGTCYIGWFKGKNIKRILGLPGAWKVECLVTVGYPAEVPEPTPRKPPEEIGFIK